MRVACLALALACAAAAQDPVLHRVAAVDVHASDGGGFARGASPYRYTLADLPAPVLPADAPQRQVLYGERLAFRFLGLRPGAHYELRASWLSDSDARTLRCALDGAVVAELRLPRGDVVPRAFPRAPSDSGELAFTVQRVSGPNAVVAGLEVWSSDPAPLRAPPPLERELRDIEVAFPRLTPRPVEVAGVAAPLLRLDGTWRFLAAAPADLAQTTAATAAAWPTIQVPGEWAMQGFAVAAGKPAAYFRAFTLPADWAGHEVRLRFHCVHSACEVWLNGRSVGTHEACFVPFELDVTDAVVPGENRLALAVTSESLVDVLASASQYAAHPLGGITRKVELFALPAAHVAGAAIVADFDPAIGMCRVRADLDVQGTAALRLCVLDAGGKTLAGAEDRLATGRTRLQFPVPGAPWDPEHPRLYRLRIEVHDGDRVIAATEQRIGFRRIEVRGNRLLVNGRPVKLKGACRHEVHPTRGRSLEPSLWRRDAELLRAANCNFVRTSHYPPAEEFLDACDELGLFVECEAALCWVQHGANSAWGTLDHEDPALFPHLLRANLANLAANRGHPSVVLWSLANESRWSPLFAEVNRRVKDADPTRPTAFHDQCWGDYNNARSTADVAVYHYPGENGPARCDQQDRPVLFGEYCHVQCYNRRELTADPGVRDDWGRGFARMWELVRRHDGCLGGAIWAAFDDVFCLPDGRTVGYGTWGCIADGWRRSKPETHHVHQVYSPVRFDVAGVRREGGTLRVGIENRYDFTDLGELRIEWRSGERSGTLSCALPPHARGELVLPASAEPVLVTCTDPRGFVCAQELLGAAPPAAGPVAAPNGRWRIDGQRVVAGETGGRAVVTGGPAFQLLPLSNEACQPVDLGTWPPLNDLAGPDLASGRFDLHPDGPRLRVRYEFTAARDVDPRQWGAVLWIDPACDTLHWVRDAQWTTYPDEHIGRPAGTARPHRAPAALPYPVRDPGQPWFLDPTVLGGHDFTATRTNVREAALRDAEGRGVRVLGGGRTAVRAFTDGTRLGLFVAGFQP
ncbi:MAG: hypothetical protein FJ265_16835, partial [Planctomycetes bacterium]|nr:hypothetical protein [Planctomycetota bacterium]